MAPMTWLRRRVRWVGLGLILAACLGVFGGTLMGGPAAASGEIGGSPGETGTSPTGTGTSNCPSSNPPNQLTLVAGTPQTTTLRSAFASGLQVALTNNDGCAVTSAAAGIPVTFSAPASGASGVFSASGSNTVIVGSDASGSVAAPTFIANDTRGQLYPHRQLAVRLGLVLADQHRRGHTSEDHRDPVEKQIRERHWTLPRAAAGKGARLGRRPSGGGDGHVHTRLWRLQHMRQDLQCQRELHRWGRAGDRDDQCIRCGELAAPHR